MDLFDSFLAGSGKFYNDDGIYCQRDLDRSDFEREYVTLRQREGRIYDDKTLLALPVIDAEQGLTKEWLVRSKSAKALAEALIREDCSSIMEVGAGNGWLINYLHRTVTVPCCGVDVGKHELRQARRVFDKDIKFIFADVTSGSLNGLGVHTIVLGSCIQYFDDVHLLLGSLMPILADNGCIHIIDSPFYGDGKSSEARTRSRAYFAHHGAVGMDQYYHHHELAVLRRYNPEFLYDPYSMQGRLRRWMQGTSPFPWIRIRKQP